MAFPAQALIAQGHDVTITPPKQETGLGGKMSGGHLIEAYGPEADVLVFQRPTNRHLAEAVPLLRAKGYAVVVDMDDDLGHIHPANPAHSGLHPRNNPDTNWHHAARACKDATLVTVSTPGLVPVYGAHGRVRVLPNRIPASYLSTPKPPSDGPVLLAWPGSLHSHPDDLREPSAAVQRLVGEGHRFDVIGDGKGVGRALGIGADPPGTGVVDFEDWIGAVATIDVGMAPLADTHFNSTKSGLKILEMASTGAAIVASDRIEYRRLADEGACEVAHRRDWYRLLKRLLTDEGWRAEWGAKARSVAERHTYEVHAHLWAESWEDALTWERSNHPAKATPTLTA